MKELLYYLKVAAWMLATVLMFYLLYFLVITFLFSPVGIRVIHHFVGDKPLFDESRYHYGSVFVYSKKFAALTGLDPDKAVMLPGGLEAIEFQTFKKRRNWQAAFSLDLINYHEQTVMDGDLLVAAVPVLYWLYPGKVGYPPLLTCAFNLYLDASIDLELPSDNANYNDDYTTVIEDSKSLEKIFQPKRMGWGDPVEEKEKTKKYNRKFRIYLVGNSTAEDGIRYAQKNSKSTNYQDISGLMYTLDYNVYKKQFFPGINFFHAGDVEGCFSLSKVYEPPYIVMKKKGGQQYDDDRYKNVKEVNFNDFYYFRVPEIIVQSEIYKKARHH